MQILRGTNIYQYFWGPGATKETAGVVVGSQGLDSDGDVWEMGAVGAWVKRTTGGAVNVADNSLAYQAFTAIASGVTSATLHTSSALEGRHAAAFFVDLFGTPGAAVHVYGSMAGLSDFGLTALALMDLRTGAIITGGAGVTVADNALSKNFAVIGLTEVPLRYLTYAFTSTSPGLCLMHGTHIRR